MCHVPDVARRSMVTALAQKQTSAYVRVMSFTPKGRHRLTTLERPLCVVSRRATFLKRGPAEYAVEAAAFLKGVNNTDTL
jgi:hypothetical protein